MINAFKAAIFITLVLLLCFCFGKIERENNLKNMETINLCDELKAKLTGLSSTPDQLRKAECRNLLQAVLLISNEIRQSIEYIEDLKTDLKIIKERVELLEADPNTAGKHNSYKPPKP